MGTATQRSRWSHLRAASLGLLLTASLAPRTLAAGATVTGVVSKQDGSPADFVDVFLEGGSPPTTIQELTDEEGKFSFAQVPPGTYKAYAFSTGMTSEVFEGITLAGGDSRQLRIKLGQLGKTETEVVKVRSSLIDLVDAKKTENSTTISSKTIESIPLQNKRIQDIVNLFAGVTKVGSSDSSDVSIQGGTGAQVGYRLNGGSLNDPVDGGALLDIPTASIETFKLITGGFGAEYGEQSTGIADIVTKSGSNTVNSQYYIDYRDTALGAASLPGLTSVQDRWNTLLNALGSPLEQEVKAGFQLLGVDPVSTLEDDHNPPNRRRLRQGILSRGPIVKDKLYFATSLEALTDDYGSPFNDGEVQQDQLLFSSKINWDIGEKDKMEGTFTMDVSHDTGVFFVDATPSVNEDGQNGTWQLNLTHQHTFDKSSLLETRLLLTHDYGSNRPENTRAGVGTQVRVLIPPGGFTSYYTGDPNSNNDQTINAQRIESSYTKTLSKHLIKAGGSFQATSFKSYTERGTDLVDFRVSDDQNLFAPPGPFAGRVNDSGPPVITDDQTWALSGYLQDKWSVNKNLTLDFGLRADYQEFVGEIFLAPRFGFSLDPIGDGKTRLFGNWGIFYDNLFANALQHEQNPDRYTSDMYFTSQFLLRKFSETPIDYIYKESLATTFNSQERDAVAFLIRGTHDTYVLSPQLTAPTNNSWSAGFERRLPGNVRFQLQYQEAHRTHQLQTRTETTRLGVNQGEYEDRDLILESRGEGSYWSWTTEIQKGFTDKWNLSFSWVQQRSTGPLLPPNNPVDPNDVITEVGLLGNDRPNVLKLQGRGRISPNKLKLDLSTDFIWQEGAPATAEIVTSNGNTARPFGRNTLRLPPSRQLNMGIKRAFKTGDGKITMTGELSIYNLLNELNVVSGLGRFELPPGVSDPTRFPPYRPVVLPLEVDVPLSSELHFSIEF